VRPAHAREKGHAEKVHSQRLVGMDEGRHVAHDDIADLDHAQLDQRRSRDAVRRGDLVVIARRGMNAEPRRIAGAQCDLGHADAERRLCARSEATSGRVGVSLRRDEAQHSTPTRLPRLKAGVADLPLQGEVHRACVSYRERRFALAVGAAASGLSGQ
jgi:hypothetical protein